MNPLLKSGRAILALALVLLSPGLEPYAAAAGSFASGARVAPAIVAVPAVGASAIRVPAATLQTINALPSTTLQLGAALPSAAVPGASATPAAAAAPAAPANAAVLAAAGVRLPAAAPRAAARPSALNDNAFSANENHPAAAATAHGQLTSGAARIGAAIAPSASVETGAAALDSVFSGAAKLEGAGVSGPAAGAMPASLGSALGRPSESGDRQDDEPQPPQAPRQSIGRSARMGFVGAVVPIAITFGAMIVAQAVGYHFHAGYQNPFPQHMTAVTAVTSLIGAAVLAPISEEMIFRGGIMGWFKSMTPARFGEKAAFILPAVASSLIFVAVHELSDPVLFATRFVHSMILSYVFHKEGYTGSIFAHGFFNGLLIMPLVLSVLLPGALASIATFSLFPLSVYFAWKAYTKIRAERADKKSGRLAAFTVTPGLALLFAAVLALGFFGIMGNIVWAVGALGWLGYAIKRWTAKRSA